MANTPDTLDPKGWHRYFAVECNNRAWALTTQTRNRAENEELLNTAHAAAYHWGVAGDELNAMRAKMLLAEAHACTGLGRSALELANEVRTYFLGRETPDWEVAFAHAIHAHAAWAAGDDAGHRESYAKALEATAAVADDGDRGIVQETLDLVPKPQGAPA